MSGFDPIGALRARLVGDPDGVAVISAAGSLTVAELWDAAVRSAVVLQEDGVSPGVTVGVVAPPLLHPVIAVALWLTGAVGGVVPPGAEGARAAGALDRVVASEGVWGAGGIPIDDDWMRRTATVDPSRFEIVPRPHDAPVRIVFSSGTTGIPTPVAFTVADIAERVRRGREHWMRSYPALSVLGLGTISGSAALFAALAAGEPHLVAGSPDETLGVLRETAATTVHASPSQLSDLLSAQERTGAALPHLRWAQSVGSPLPEMLAARLERRLGVQVEVVYGATEVGAASIRRGPARTPGDVGEILPCVNVEIVDDAGGAVAEGEEGAVRIRERPPGRAPGAWHLPGDRGRIVGGRLAVLGRVDDLINAAGVKVAPERVEAVALEHPGVHEAVAVGVTDRRGVSAAGLVVLADRSVDLARLRARLSEALGDAAPRVIERAASLPRSENGKILRRLLADDLSARLAGEIEL